MPPTVGPSPPSEQYWLDRQWIHDNYPNLVDNNPNEWIAVHRGKVLASGPHLLKVQAAARVQSAAPDIVYQFIDDGSLIF